MISFKLWFLSQQYTPEFPDSSTLRLHIDILNCFFYLVNWSIRIDRFDWQTESRTHFSSIDDKGNENQLNRNDVDNDRFLLFDFSFDPEERIHSNIMMVQLAMEKIFSPFYYRRKSQIIKVRFSFFVISWFLLDFLHTLDVFFSFLFIFSPSYLSAYINE